MASEASLDASVDRESAPLTDAVVLGMLDEMEDARRQQQAPRCFVCETFPPKAVEFINRAFVANFSRAAIREKLREIGIHTSSDTLAKHWNSHGSRDVRQDA